MKNKRQQNFLYIKIPDSQNYFTYFTLWCKDHVWTMPDDKDSILFLKKNNTAKSFQSLMTNSTLLSGFACVSVTQQWLCCRGWNCKGNLKNQNWWLDSCYWNVWIMRFIITYSFITRYQVMMTIMFLTCFTFRDNTNLAK